MAAFRFALVAMLLAGIAGISAIVTMQFAVHRAEVRVPDLKGRSIAEASSRAAALGLDLSVTQRLYSTALPAGTVLLQTPAPGASVRRGWDLAVAESLGPQQVAIPDVVGKSERDAILLIRQRGLELGSVAHMPSNSSQPGTVLAQDPPPLARGAERPSVSLLVAVPAPQVAKAWVMPDERGKDFAAAQAELDGAGLHAESATGAPPGAQFALPVDAAPGTVISQTPAAGAKVDAAIPVIFWITGPGPADRRIPTTPLK